MGMVDLSFNALREAAQSWCSCEDAGLDAATCESQASDVYSEAGGNPSEWTATEQAQASDVKDGLCSGAMTSLVYSEAVDMVFEFSSVCSAYDTSAVYTS